MKEIQIVFTGNTTKLTSKFENYLELKPNSKIGLNMISSVYNLYNVNHLNNHFRFVIGENNDLYVNGYIPPGSYDLESLQNTFEVIMKTHDENNNEIRQEFTAKVGIEVDYGTGKSIITIPKDVRIDLDVENSIGQILGTNRLLRPGYHLSEEVIRIEPVTCFFLHCDLADGAFINGKVSQCIYQFLPTVRLGHSFLIERNYPSFQNISSSKDKISEITVWLTDEHNNPIDLNGEQITIVLTLQMEA